MTNKKSSINLKPKANLAFILIFKLLKKIFLEVIFINLNGYVNSDENSAKIKEGLMKIQSLSNWTKNSFGIQGGFTNFKNLLNDAYEQICQYLIEIAKLHNQQSKLYKTQFQNLNDSRKREKNRRRCL